MSYFRTNKYCDKLYGVELQRSLWKVAEAEKPINRKVTKEIEVF
jgi:hypothetical protein